ncbi:MAG: hypothetical protein V4819_20235 [Verrucomicrobiota bacterium]
MLSKFDALRGGEKIAFFRANKSLLLAADAERGKAAKASESPQKAAVVEAPAGRSVDTAPEELLSRFYGLQGKAKTAFFRANKPLLKAAAAVVEKREAARVAAASRNEGEAAALRTFASQARAFEAKGTVPATLLLDEFQTLTGKERISFFRANRQALMVA